MYIKSNCKYIIGINLIDMATTNFVNLTTLFSFVLCLLVHFSGFLLDLAFYSFVPFFIVSRAQTTTCIYVGYHCYYYLFLTFMFSSNQHSYPPFPCNFHNFCADFRQKYFMKVALSIGFKEKNKKCKCLANCN